MASTTSNTGDTSSKQQQAQRKENYNNSKRPVSSVDHCHPHRISDKDERLVRDVSPSQGLLQSVIGSTSVGTGLLQEKDCILANFWKVEVGTLEIMHMWFRLWSRSDHCEGEALAFLGGSGGMLPRKILKIKTVKYAFFKVLVNDSTHLLQEKVSLKYIPFSCVQRKMTGEWPF